ncbi:eukaryotic translation elongation factor 1 epsilon-1 [Aethina tumida]|uniref:eukaryotic translation elongation factor 1 epsilon-1 n=1 Tax=Aethina tumida TaxID=116153 RepID=UPI00096B11A1|nr:eukaryotic translation elongation factor 1 epsilon-1 [Aethina tumida]
MTSSRQYIQQISDLLKIKVANLNEENGVSCTINGKQVSGFVNIINVLLSASKTNLAGSNELENLQIYQWLEYALLYAAHCNSVHNIQQTLGELNSVLATKTFIASVSKLTIADVLLYYILYNLIESLAYLDKEKYIHVSRWFNNVQQDSKIRQSNKMIDFRSNFLVNLAPARHF